MAELIKITALKYPNIPHYEWEGEMLEKTDDYILLLCKPGRKLIHHTKNKVFIEENTSIEYFSLAEWYTAAMKVADEEIVSYYCNVAMPSVLEGNNLSFIDLDLDLLKQKNEDFKVVDEDEFAENSIRLNYPTQLKTRAIKALEELKAQAIRGEFPFNQDVLKWVK